MCRQLQTSIVTLTSILTINPQRFLPALKMMGFANVVSVWCFFIRWRHQRPNPFPLHGGQNSENLSQNLMCRMQELCKMECRNFRQRISIYHIHTPPGNKIGPGEEIMLYPKHGHRDRPVMRFHGWGDSACKENITLSVIDFGLMVLVLIGELICQALDMGARAKVSLLQILQWQWLRASGVGPSTFRNKQDANSIQLQIRINKN